MSSPSVITLRVSKELKDRLASMADHQGVSMNQLLTYYLTEKVTTMEMHERIQQRFERIQGKSIEELQQAALAVLDSQRELEPHEIPEWDRWPEGESITYDATPAQPEFSVNEGKPTYKPNSKSES